MSLPLKNPPTSSNSQKIEGSRSHPRVHRKWDAAHLSIWETVCYIATVKENGICHIQRKWNLPHPRKPAHIENGYHVPSNLTSFHHVNLQMLGGLSDTRPSASFSATVCSSASLSSSGSGEKATRLLGWVFILVL